MISSELRGCNYIVYMLIKNNDFATSINKFYLNRYMRKNIYLVKIK